MAKTKKEYVLEVTNAIQENPKVILSGHGLSGQMLGLIASRPDIIAKLVNFSTKTVNWKKGKNALKKAKNFKISAYRNFNDFNKKAELDVAKFVERLDPKDAELFSTKNRVLTMLCIPEKEVGDIDLENEIANGLSQLLPFDKASQSQYKLPRGFYITVMFGDSVILTKAKALAMRTKAKNAKLVERETKVAKVKSAFVKKNKARLANLKRDISQLKNQLDVHSNLASNLQELGIKSGKIADIKAGKLQHDNRIKQQLNKLSDKDNLALEQARQLWKDGFQKEAQSVAKKIASGDRQVVLDYIKNDGLIDSNSKLRRKVEQAQRNLDAYKKQLTGARRNARNADTPLARKKAKAEVERLKKQAEFEARKAENARTILVNKSANRGGKIDALTKKIEALSAKGLGLQKATATALNDIEISKAKKQQLLRSINGQLGQQIAQLPVAQQNAITPQIAQQVLQVAIENAVQQVAPEILKTPIATEPVIPTPKKRGRPRKTPLAIKKEKAELEREKRQIPTQNVTETVIEPTKKAPRKRSPKAKTPLQVKQEIAKNKAPKTASQVAKKVASTSNPVSKNTAENRAKQRSGSGKSFQEMRLQEIKKAKQAQKLDAELMGEDSDLFNTVLSFI